MGTESFAWFWTSLLNESRNVFCENFNPKEFQRHFTLDVVTLLNASEYLLK